MALRKKSSLPLDNGLYCAIMLLNVASYTQEENMSKERIAEVRINLSSISLLEDGISLLNFDLVKTSIQSLIKKRFPGCDIFVNLEFAEATHIYLLDEDGNMICTDNHNLWLNAISAIEFVLNELRQNNVYPYLN